MNDFINLVDYTPLELIFFATGCYLWVIVYYLYQQAFEWGRMGYACALAMVLLVLVFIFTLLQWRFGGQGLRSQY